MITHIILGGSISLLLVSLAVLRQSARAQRERSHRQLEMMSRLPRDLPVQLSAHHPLSGRGLSMPLYPNERTLGSLGRMLGEGTLVITAVEGFDRADPRHVQSLWGALRTFELVVAERGGERVDTLSLQGADVDDLIAQADYPALFRLAESMGLNDPLRAHADAGATLAMPAFKLEAA